MTFYFVFYFKNPMKNPYKVFLTKWKSIFYVNKTVTSEVRAKIVRGVYMKRVLFCAFISKCSQENWFYFS